MALVREAPAIGDFGNGCLRRQQRLPRTLDPASLDISVYRLAESGAEASGCIERLMKA